MYNKLQKLCKRNNTIRNEVVKRKFCILCVIQESRSVGENDIREIYNIRLKGKRDVSRLRKRWLESKDGTHNGT